MKTKYIAASSLGNLLEWLDFGLFVYLAALIGEQFFPISDPQTAAIAAFGVFAAGSICRPLGGIVFGHLGDRLGRVVALRWSIFLITLTTLLIGLLPTYSQLGITAAILFTLLRLLQGLSVGGEYIGVAVYIAELAPRKYRGFFAAFAASSANIGFLLATLMALILKLAIPLSILSAWGWRIPFIFSGLLGLGILYYRLQLIETPAYLQLRANQALHRRPFLAALRMAPWQLLKIFALTAMGSSCYYIFFGYMPTYLAEYTGYSLPAALGFQASLLVTMVLFIPIAGALGDHFGRKKMLLIATVGILILILPCFYLLHYTTALPILVALTIVMILSSLEQGNTLVTAIENCPVEVRYSGVSFAYSLGNALWGGSSPLIASVLAQSIGHFAPAYYLMVMALISLLAISCLRQKSKNQFVYDAF
jgi:MFS transporter, MHS family, proline/betaine transporter